MYTQCSAVLEIILPVFSSSTAAGKKLVKCLASIAKALALDEVVGKLCGGTAVHFMYADWVRKPTQNHKTRRAEALKKNIHPSMLFSVLCISVPLWSRMFFFISNKNMICYFASTRRNFSSVYGSPRASIGLTWEILFRSCCCVYITSLGKHQTSNNSIKLCSTASSSIDGDFSSSRRRVVQGRGKGNGISTRALWWWQRASASRGMRCVYNIRCRTRCAADIRTEDDSESKCFRYLDDPHRSG